MRAVTLMVLLSFLAACGQEEAHDHDHDKAPTKSDVEKMAGDMNAGGAEMKTITLSIDGMT